MKWRVEGRIRCDINFVEVVDAPDEEHAVEKAQDKVCRKHGISEGDYIDDEFYAEELP